MATTLETPRAPATFSLLDHMIEKHGPLMRTAAVAEVLGCSMSHARAMCESGELPARQIGKRWFVVTSKLVEMLEGDA